MFGIPYRGRQIETNFRNSVPKHFPEENTLSILFKLFWLICKTNFFREILFRSELRNWLFRIDLAMSRTFFRRKMETVLSLHCKKSCRRSSTPASGDAGPKHTGIEKSFRHPYRKFYYKYRTFPAFFTSVELVRQSLNFSKAAYPPGLELAIFTSTIFYSTTAPHFLPCLCVHWRIERFSLCLTVKLSELRQRKKIVHSSTQHSLILSVSFIGTLSRQNPAHKQNSHWLLTL